MFRKQQWPLLIIIGAPLFLMGLSYSLFFLNHTKSIDVVNMLGTKTSGQLLVPTIPLKKLKLTNQKGLPFKHIQLNKTWTLLVLAKNKCPTCTQNLIESRQMHVALGKHANKLSRLQLFIDQPLSQEAIKTANESHPKLRLANADSHAFNELPKQIRDSDYLLVDAKGWIMMTYPTGTNEKAMMSDFKHLFKYAQ